MAVRRMAILIGLFSVTASASDTNVHEPEIKAQAVSKGAYDEIQRIGSVLGYLSSIGISESDIEPNNLQFASNSYDSCVTQVRTTLSTPEEIAVGEVSCFMRHFRIRAESRGLP